MYLRIRQMIYLRILCKEKSEVYCISQINKLQTHRPRANTCHKWSFTGTQLQPSPFVTNSLQLFLSIATVFSGQRENIWPTKCVIFPLWPFIEKVCWLLLDFLQSKITVNTPGPTLEKFYRSLTEILWNTPHRRRQPIAVGLALCFCI